MTAIDTNVLLRYVVQDDPPQSARASRFINHMQAAGDRVFISKIVLCEAVWTLRYHYKYAKPDILHLLESLFAQSSFEIEDEASALRARDDYRRHAQGDFPDYWIGHTAKAQGCDPVRTFDQGMKGSALFVQL